MTTYVQVHALMNYPPSVPNRDDDGRPKSVYIGGTERQRISSQCLKHSIRNSEPFISALHGEVGKRSKYIIDSIESRLTSGDGLDADMAREAAEAMGKVFGQSRKSTSKKSQGEESGGVLFFLTHSEVQNIQRLTETLRNEKRLPTEDEVAALPASKKEIDASNNVSGDVALMGRMAASSHALDVDAAIAMSHAYTVHEATIRPDYWTGGSDQDTFFHNAKVLNGDIDDAGHGAGHIGVQEMGAGLYYIYAAINRDLLVDNLGGDEQRADATIDGFITGLTTTTPSGKKTQFGQGARALYVLREEGTHNPRGLHEAFLEALSPGDVKGAIKKLQDTKAAFDRAYGEDWTSREVNVLEGEGELEHVLTV